VRDRVLNVAQITSYYPPHLGGVETVAERLAEGLSRHHRVWVITTTAGATGALRHVERRNLRVNRYRSRRVANVELFPGALVGVARLPRGTVLHAHVTEAFVPELAALGAQLGKGPLVAHYHMDVRATGQKRLYERWKDNVLGPVLRRADRVIVLSNHQRAEVVARYRVRPERICVLPNGVDDVYFQPRAPRPYGPGPLRLLFVGRLSPQKDLPLLFDAVRVLGPKAELVVAGDGELRHDVEAMARASLSGQARVVGAQTPQQLGEWYRWADVLVSSSEREGMPLCFLEAMASGLPVVATDVAGTRETLAGAGRLVPRSGTALAAAVDDLRTHPRQAEEMGAAGRQLVEPLRWSRITEVLEEIYDGIS
jgi:glycosyltransferase involved in cell wall biosynthesis